MDKKHLLFITFSFPPLNASGTMRTSAFAKYLSDFGWKPIVVSPDWNETNCQPSSIYDPTLVDDSNCHVFRVEYNVQEEEQFNSVRSKVLRWFGDTWLYRDFYKSMETQCKKILKEFPIKAILTSGSSNPKFIYSLSSKLQQMSGLPWIVDHRDIPDQEDHYSDSSFKNKLFIKNSSWITARYTRNASLITTVSEPLAVKLRRRNSAPVNVILNGYDPAIFNFSYEINKSKNLFRIVYCGGFFGGGDPSIFLDGLDLLAREYPELSTVIEVWFYGKSSDAIKKYLSERPCKALVKSGGYLTHKDCLRKQAEAQIVFLISHRSKGIVTGKLFEYLNSGSPILSVPGDEDITDKIIKDTKAGAVCRNKEEVCQQLQQWLEEWKANSSLYLSTDKELVSTFSRKEQTGELAALLDKLV